MQIVRILIIEHPGSYGQGQEKQESILFTVKVISSSAAGLGPIT